MIGEAERAEMAELRPEMVGKVIRVTSFDTAILENGGVGREEPLGPACIEPLDSATIVRENSGYRSALIAAIGRMCLSGDTNKREQDARS